LGSSGGSRPSDTPLPLRSGGHPESDDEDDGEDETVTISKDEYVSLLDTVDRLKLEVVELQRSRDRMAADLRVTIDERDEFRVGHSFVSSPNRREVKSRRSKSDAFIIDHGPATLW